MRALLAAALLFVGCARVRAVPPRPLGPDECSTACGLIGVRLSCDDLQKLEDAARDAFVEHVGHTEESFCRGISGWTVREHEWTDADLECQARGGWKHSSLCVRGFIWTTQRELEIDHLRRNFLTGPRDWARS